MRSKVRTRIESILLVAVMLLSLLPIHALADGPIPVDTGDELTEALTSGGSIQLVGDITVGTEQNWTITKDVVLDLNGHNITSTYGESNYYLMTVRGASLTVTDTSAYEAGTISANVSGGYGIQLYSNSTFNLEGGTIISKNETVDIYTITTGCTVNISGGKLVSTADSAMNVRGSGTEVNITDGELVSEGGIAGVFVSSGSGSTDPESIVFNMDGGKLTSTSGPAILTDYALTVNYGGDAVIESENTGISVKGSTVLNVTGGTITADSYALQGRYDSSIHVTDGKIETTRINLAAVDVSDNSTVEIKGGTLVGSKALTGNKENITVAGGTFQTSAGTKVDVSEYLPEGNTQDENGQVIVDTATAKFAVDGVGYTTLEKALAALKDGSTMTIQPGEYDVTTVRTSKPTYGSGFIIDKKNVTIQAADPNDKPVLYGFSNEFNAGVDSDGINGQDTIYVSGSGVTLKDLVIMPLGGVGPNANNWQKTVEVTSTATGFTMTGCETTPNTHQKDGQDNSMAAASGNIHVSINDAKISGNNFGAGTTVSAGWKTSAADTYSVDVSGNYWGDGVTAADIAGKIDGNVKVDDYYADAGMTELVTVGGTPVSTVDQLEKALTAAKNGDTIVLAPGEYNGNIHFAEKSLTIKGANAGIDPNTGVRGEETVFTGTMSTSYEPMCSTDPQHNKPYDSTFNADQKVIIDGITFSGDGLKVGDNNYNSVGDLTVTNCIFVPGNDLPGDTQHSTDGTTNRDWAQNMYNYFVKVSNDPEKGYFAKVTLTNNKIDGNTTSTVATYPVALWCVDDVTVNNNVFDFDTPALAINISKADDQAKIAVNNNKITNVTTAVYFSTWAVPAETFTGSVEIKNNQIVNATSEEVIFVGYDGEPHKEFAGSVNAVGNTLDSKPVDVVIGVKDEESSALVTATFKDGSTVIGSISGAPSGEANAFTFTLPAALTKANYTFIGWSNGENTFDAGDVVAITADTTFTARWSYNGGSSSGSGSSSSSGDYIVSVDKTTNGKITVSPSRADKGDTVTITVKPDAGYELDELIVTDKNGDTVKLTDKGNGKYTFTMPGSKVEITATFVEITEEQVDPFTDVTTSDYYYDAVLWAVENGVTNGTSATTFSPNMAVSRAQMVTFLWRAHGAPKATGTNPFTDVSTSDYYYDAVLWAVANGVTNGTSATTFSPDMAVTRAQAVTFQWRAAGSDTVSGSNFGDVAADAYYANAVTWAVANGITNGTGGDNFSPDVVVSRAQAVTFLYRELA